MDAFTLAERFKDFVAREWSAVVRFDEIDPADLYSYFGNWAQEKDGDLVGETGGSYAMGLQTWIIVQSWYEKNPDDFAAIRPYVTVALELPPTHDNQPIETWLHNNSLPGLLDEGEWNRQVFKRMCPPRE